MFMIFKVIFLEIDLTQNPNICNNHTFLLPFSNLFRGTKDLTSLSLGKQNTDMC
jgi:hypothetical protein